MIADAQLASTSPTDFGGAVVAFMNPGGIRGDLICSAPCSTASPANVTYNQLFTVQPFNNVMTVKTLTGTQIEQLLEQQWCGPNVGAVKILQVSAGFSYHVRRRRDHRRQEHDRRLRPRRDRRHLDRRHAARRDERPTASR